jgi:hypothetical protein
MRRQVLEHGRASLGVIRRCHEAAWLVEQPKPGRFSLRQRRTIDRDLIARGHIERRTCDHSAIDRDPPGRNPILGIAARAEPGAGHDARNALTFRRNARRTGPLTRRAVLRGAGRALAFEARLAGPFAPLITEAGCTCRIAVSAAAKRAIPLVPAAEGALACATLAPFEARFARRTIGALVALGTVPRGPCAEGALACAALAPFETRLAWRTIGALVALGTVPRGPCAEGALACATLAPFETRLAWRTIGALVALGTVPRGPRAEGALACAALAIFEARFARRTIPIRSAEARCAAGLFETFAFGLAKARALIPLARGILAPGF